MCKPKLNHGKEQKLYTCDFITVYAQIDRKQVFYIKR